MLSNFYHLNISIFSGLKLIFLGILFVATIPLPSLGDPQTIIVASNDEKVDGNGNEDFEQENSIQICCAWGDALADGRLTYFISDEDSSEKQQEAVSNAIKKWDKKINPLELEESLDRNGSDIRVDFKRNNKQDIAGKTMSTYDGYGLISKIEITSLKELIIINSTTQI